MSEPASIADTVFAVRAVLGEAADKLQAVEPPPTAPVFRLHLDRARHHLSVAKLQLANALSIGLPR